jgi:hypothetical protein
MRIKKIIAFNVLILIAILLAPLMVSAQLEIAETYSASNPTFGDDSQEASNSEADDEDDRIVTVTNTVPVTNNVGSNVNITGISFANGKFGLKASDFKLLTPNGTTITTGSTFQVSINAVIPESLDAIDSDFELSAFNVGDLTIQTTNGSVTFQVFMQRENKLEIDDFDALINDKDTESNIKDGDEIKDLKPGDKVELIIRVKSNYNSKSELDIENVEIDVACEDDQDLDFDDDNVDAGDLGPKDDQEELILMLTKTQQMKLQHVYLLLKELTKTVHYMEKK